MKLLDLELDYYEIEVCHTSSWLGGRINQLRSLKQLEVHTNVTRWKVHELHESLLAFLSSHVIEGIIIMTC